MASRNSKVGSLGTSRNDSAVGDLKKLTIDDSTKSIQRKVLEKENELKLLNEDDTKSETSYELRKKLEELNAAIKEEKRKKDERHSKKTLTIDDSTKTIQRKVLEKENELKLLNEHNTKSKTSYELRKKLEELNSAINEEKRIKHERHSKKHEEMSSKTKELSRLKYKNARKQAIKEVVKKVKDAQKTDLVFLIDCTFSMQPYIDAVRDDIKKIIDDVKEQFVDAKIQVAFIGYRDHCDADRLIIKPFSSDYDQTAEFLNSIEAAGGGDTAEDIFGGLESVLALNWSSNCRVLTHFCDAPCHGNRFHNLDSDDDASFNSEDRRGLNIENLISSLKSKNIDYYFGKITDDTDKMIKEFQRVSGRLDYPLQVDADKPKKVSSSVVDSVINSISRCTSTTLGEEGRRIKYGVAAIDSKLLFVKEKPNWNVLDRENATVFECVLPTSMLYIKNEFPMNSEKRSIKMAKQPFSKGSIRLSFYGLDVSNRIVIQLVLKQFQQREKSKDLFNDYHMCMETQTMAQFFAMEFNKISPKVICKSIRYLPVSVIQLERSSGPVYCNMEDLLPDYENSFKKWSNNGYYINKEDYCPTVDAFSHWTYHISNKYLIIVDIQGVDQTNEIILTDPAIHCTDLNRFGETNFGADGMKMYLKMHKCNNICIRLGLPSV